MSEAHKGSLIASRHLIMTQRLRERRDDLGLTQKQIVTRLAKCGLQTTNRALSSLEHGAGLDVAKLPELAIALDCTVTYLIGLTDDPHSWVPDPAAVPAAVVPAAQRVVSPDAAPSPPPVSPPQRQPAARPPAGRAPRVRPPTPSESFILGTYIPDRTVGLRRPGPPR